jgi:hypothetical protein
LRGEKIGVYEEYKNIAFSLHFSGRSIADVNKYAKIDSSGKK